MQKINWQNCFGFIIFGGLGLDTVLFISCVLIIDPGSDGGPTTKAEENFVEQSFDRIWTGPPFHFFCCTVVKSLVNYPTARIPKFIPPTEKCLFHFFPAGFCPGARFYFTAGCKISHFRENLKRMSRRMPFSNSVFEFSIFSQVFFQMFLVSF